MRRPGLTRSVRDLLRDRREPTYPVEAWTPGTDEPMRGADVVGHFARPTEPPPKPADMRAPRPTPVVSTSLADYTDTELTRLAHEVGREMRRRAAPRGYDRDSTKETR